MKTAFKKLSLTLWCSLSANDLRAKIRNEPTAGLVYTKIVFTILEATSWQAQKSSHSYKYAHTTALALTYTHSDV